MHLTVNKKEAELLKDVHIIDNERKVGLSLSKDNINIAEIFVNGTDSYGTKTVKSVLVRIMENGEIVIGYRNRYGNGHRSFNIEAFEKLLWQDGDKTDNLKLLRENKGSYTLS